MPVGSQLAIFHDSIGNDSSEFPQVLSGRGWNVDTLGDPGVSTNGIIAGSPPRPSLDNWWSTVVGTPDVAIVQVMINDIVNSQPNEANDIFYRILQIAQSALDQGVPNVVVLTPVPLASNANYGSAGSYAEVDRLIRTLTSSPIQHFDIQPHLDTNGDGATEPQWTADGLHPNAAGSIVLTNAIEAFLLP